MFVRKKRNKSGVVSIQVIDKSSGKYKLLKTIGSSSNPEQIEFLFKKGKHWIKQYTRQQELDFNSHIDSEEIFSSIQEIKANGAELILGKIFNDIGFNIIDNHLLYYLTIARVVHRNYRIYFVANRLSCVLILALAKTYLLASLAWLIFATFGKNK